MERHANNATDAEVLEHTGHDIAYWNHLLSSSGAMDKSGVDVSHWLETEHKVPKAWAHTLTAKFLKQKLGSWKD